MGAPCYPQITQITQKPLGSKTAKSATLCGQCFFQSVASVSSSLCNLRNLRIVLKLTEGRPHKSRRRYFEMVEAEVFSPVRSTCAVVGTFSMVRWIN